MPLPPTPRTSPAALLPVFLVSFGLAASIAGAEPNAATEGATETAAKWELEDSDADEGWELYTAQVAGSDHLRYRLISQSHEPVERVAAAIQLKLRDTRYSQEGQDRTILSSGDGYMINYVRMHVPLISDRDVVIETRWWTDAETSAYHVAWAPPSGPVPPVPEGVTRIESRGAWAISPLPNGGSQVVYTQHSELGDSIPSWLVSRLLNAQIVNESRALHEILADDLPAVGAPPVARRSAAAGRLPVGATSLID